MKTDFKATPTKNFTENIATVLCILKPLGSNIFGKFFVDTFLSFSIKIRPQCMPRQSDDCHFFEALKLGFSTICELTSTFNPKER